MAHLWFRNAGDELWSAMPLNGLAVDIRSWPPRALPGEFCLGNDDAVIIKSSSDGWALLAAAGSGVRVNGLIPAGGLRVLQDRDEIRTGTKRVLYFSAETLANVMEFPGAETTIYCGRCRQALEQGQEAVCCPQCSIWFHQTKELPCWTYSPTCICPQPTALDASYSWVPED
jgi:hypothetical protein